MGGIVCVTPHDAVGQAVNVKRSGSMSATEVVNPNAGLKTVAIQDLDSLSSTATTVISQCAAELLWLYGKSTGTRLPGWNGFMEKASENGEYQHSKIIYLPIINAPPSDYDTVYTSLLIAHQKYGSVKRKTCFITFDQPLYIKA
ncbi:hypothetical protein PR048_002156 [Dryococelus australis]|uniref:Uncharacterized protein n=1 Tax=Dryococelus australis TaxID=614101 RepID=A0ABQ9IJC6_9NEOP|nr:hypothetical protein PR048_002156 [Dryococelus australis]